MRKPRIRQVGAIATVCLGLVAQHAIAATGTITVQVNTANNATITKSSNISGPSFVRGTATFTASINTGGNNQSGTLTADMAYNNYEYLCNSSFVTSVVNGVCSVALNNVAGGYHGAKCTYTPAVVNKQTCDFTAKFIDAPGDQVPPPPPP